MNTIRSDCRVKKLSSRITGEPNPGLLELYEL